MIIESGPVLKKETELIDNLTDMKITAEILASSKQSVDVNLIDSQYNNLGLNEATPLDHSSDEFKYLCAYLTKTHGTTHHLTLQVEDIFRITRSEEVERWDAANFDTIPNSNRKLLWHGSRTTNYSGILSQGLRIAPPEAPVSGYMFDKGIYLADIATKSANYCYANISNNTGLLMLCEAQLGDPMLELKNASYTAAKECAQAGRLATKGLGRTAPLKWEDAGVVNENLKGVEMPKVSGGEKTIIGPSNASGLCLEYNEVSKTNPSLSPTQRLIVSPVHRLQRQPSQDPLPFPLQVWIRSRILLIRPVMFAKCSLVSVESLSFCFCVFLWV